jgi:hypothetical protein
MIVSGVSFALLVSFCVDKNLQDCPTPITRVDTYSRLQTCEYNKKAFSDIDWPQVWRDKEKTPYARSECQMR